MRWVLAVVVVVLAGTSTGIVAWAGEAPPAPPGPPTGTVSTSAYGLADEITALRTRASRTFRTDDGRRVTQLYAGSVNFRSDGRWRKIDNRLVRKPGGSLENRANRYRAAFPSRLGDDAIEVRSGGASVTFDLAGARGAAADAAGESVTYRDALTDVDVRYDTLPDAVKETLVLKSPRAPREFRFKLGLSGGLAARMTSAGDLEVVGTDGRARFVVPAPIAWQDGDEAQPTDDPVRFRYDADEQLLTLQVDDAWLTAPGRRFPVSVDPYVTLVTDGRDCTLSSKPAEQGTSICSSADLKVGDHGGYTQHAIVDFDVADQLPEHVTIQEAYAAFWLKSASGGWQEQVASALTRPFVDGQATWTRAATGINWTTPGGDFSPAAAKVKWFGGSDGVNAWSYWALPDQVQRWAEGTDPDYGLILRPASTPAEWTGTFSSSNETNAARRPYLTVSYEPTYGEDGPFTFVREDLPGISHAVNVATGRLTVRDTDANVTAAGPGFALERFYNNADERCCSPLEAGWRLGAAPTAWIGGNQDIVVDMPSGTILRFPWDDTTETYGPDRLGTATLSVTASYWIVQRPADGQIFYFDPDDGRLVKRKRAGQSAEVLYGYDGSGRLETVTAPGNQVTTLDYDADGLLASASSPGTDSIVYGYDDGHLVHRTKGNATTGYGYTGGRLSHVWSPDGKVAFHYDSAGRVTELIRVTDIENHTGPTTTFTYHDRSALGSCPSASVGRTVVTTPEYETITYCYDAKLRASNATTPVLFGDANADGLDDAVQITPAGAITARLSNGSGVFGASQTWGSWPNAQGLAIGDVNGDGADDLVGRTAGSSDVRVALGNGTTFAPPVSWLTGVSGAVSLGDVDGDGLSDVVLRAADGTVRAAASTGTSFADLAVFATISPDAATLLGDVTGDDQADLVTILAGNVAVRASDTATFLAPQAWGTAGSHDVRLGDANGDDVADLLRRDANGVITAALSDGTSFSLPVQTGALPGYLRWSAADVDGDLRIDAVGRGGEEIQTSLGVAPYLESDGTGWSPGSDTPEEDDVPDPIPGQVSTLSVPNTTMALAWSDDDLVVDPLRTVDEALATPQRCAPAQPALDRMRQTGARYIRFVVLWSRYVDDGQASLGYQRGLRNAVHCALASGLTPYFTLTSADYDGPTPKHVNPDPAAFGAWVGSVVTTFYPRGVKRYAMWNEPNYAKFLRVQCAAPNAAQTVRTTGLYRQLYDAGYTAARGATNNQALVYAGELSELNHKGRTSCGAALSTNKKLSTIQYLETLTASAPLRTNGVAWHAYQHRRNPRTKSGHTGIYHAQYFQERISDLYRPNSSNVRRIATPNGQSKPGLYITEFGYFNVPFRGEPGTNWTEETRAAWLELALDRAARSHVKLFLFWQLNEAYPSLSAIPANRTLIAFDTGMLAPGTLAVDGTRPYGKGPNRASFDYPQQRRAYCRVRQWALSSNISRLGSTTAAPLPSGC